VNTTEAKTVAALLRHLLDTPNRDSADVALVATRWLTATAEQTLQSNLGGDDFEAKLRELGETIRARREAAARLTREEVTQRRAAQARLAAEEHAIAAGEHIAVTPPKPGRAVLACACGRVLDATNMHFRAHDSGHTLPLPAVTCGACAKCVAPDCRGCAA
jgi:hypothetical protein